MANKGLIRLSVAALVLIFIGISGCSDNSNRIYSPQTDGTNDQLATGLDEEYFTDGNPGDYDGYPIYDDGESDDGAELQPYHRHDRNKRVPQRVAEVDGAFR